MKSSERKFICRFSSDLETRFLLSEWRSWPPAAGTARYRLPRWRWRRWKPNRQSWAALQSKVKSGRYNSASDVVREALRLLEQRDEVFTRRQEEIREQIEEGWQSAERGKLVDGDEVFDRIDAELEAMERSAPK
jgi:antitoxin ParD1/3/4